MQVCVCASSVSIGYFISVLKLRRSLPLMKTWILSQPTLIMFRRILLNYKMILLLWMIPSLMGTL